MNPQHHRFFHPWPLGTCSSLTTKRVKWLKKYIKLLKVDKLKLLLLFCTGSNMQGLKRRVMFFVYDAELDPNNFMRCPEARTCGPTLRLPNNYRKCTMPDICFHPRSHYSSSDISDIAQRTGCRIFHCKHTRECLFEDRLRPSPRAQQ